MLTYFGRRKQRLDRFTATIKTADDRSLAAVLMRASTEELAAVLGLLTVDRANRLVVNVPKDRLDAALTLSLEASATSERTLAKLATELSGPATPLDTGPNADPAAATTPMCIKALDLAGRVFGTLTVQPKE